MRLFLLTALMTSCFFSFSQKIGNVHETMELCYGNYSSALVNCEEGDYGFFILESDSIFRFITNKSLKIYTVSNKRAGKDADGETVTVFDFVSDLKEKGTIEFDKFGMYINIYYDEFFITMGTEVAYNLLNKGEE